MNLSCISTIPTYKWHFWVLSICNLRKLLGAREYNQRRLRMVCQAYVQSDTKIVVLFEQ